MHANGSTGYGEPLLATTDAGATGEQLDTWVFFSLDEQTYALRIWEVERIVRAVEIKPVPETPPHVLGVVNIQGKVLPAVDLRVRFGRPSRDIRLDDHFIVAKTSESTVVLPVDAALGSVEVAGGTLPDDEISRSQCLHKVLTVGTEMVYALDLAKVVSTVNLPIGPEPSSLLVGLETA